MSLKHWLKQSWGSILSLHSSWSIKQELLQGPTLPPVSSPRGVPCLRGGKVLSEQPGPLGLPFLPAGFTWSLPLLTVNSPGRLLAETVHLFTLI